MDDLKAIGVNFIAPPMWVLLVLKDGNIIPSTYIVKAHEAGINIIAWTIEPSGPLQSSGG